MNIKVLVNGPIMRHIMQDNDITKYLHQFDRWKPIKKWLNWLN